MVQLPATIVAIGGGSRSDLLLQTIADAVGADVVRPVGEEFGARGASLLAAYAAGVLTRDRVQQLSSAFDVERVFTPDTDRVARQFDRYIATRDALWEIWSA